MKKFFNNRRKKRDFTLTPYAQYNESSSSQSVSSSSSALSPAMNDAQTILRSNLCYGIITIFLYLLVGVVAYSFIFEGWDWVDSLYFSMVTFTTVGYGDISPETQEGRLFTIFYAVSGVAIIGSIVGMIGEQFAESQMKALKRSNRKREEKAFEMIKDKGRLSRSKSFAQLVDEGSSFGEFLKDTIMVLPLIMFFLCGAYFEINDQGGTTIDFVYYSVVTLTTIGYGDIAPDDKRTKALAVFVVPLAAFATATIIARYAAFAAERKILKDQAKVIDRGLRLSDLELMDKDKNGTVDRLEFIEFMLLSMDKVDADFLNRLNAQFDELDKDGSGTLDKDDLVLKVKASNTNSVNQGSNYASVDIA